MSGSQDEDSERAEGPIDLASRHLCPDEACVGVLGPDGRCAVCGAAAVAADSSGGAKPSGGTAEGQTVAHPNDSPLALDAIARAAANDDGTEHVDGAPFDEARRLCPDGDCIGLLDEAGRCRLCGRTG